jgi:cytoskeletal protein CcmA (bactofilin family)
MANRFPLIVDSSSNQIKELEASDNIDLTNSGIVNAQSISATHLNLSGVVTASSFSGNGSGLTGVASTDNIQTATSANFLSNVNIAGITTCQALTVSGNLTVDGTTTTINSTTLTVDDKTIVIASGAADSSAADGAGISIDGASATILYSHSGTKFVSNKPFEATSFSGDGSGLTGVASTDNIQTATVANFLDGVTVAGVTTTSSNVNVTGNVTVTGDVSATNFNSTSDVTLKQDVSVIDNALEMISQLEGVSWKWKESLKPSLGVTAQNVEEVAPELVSNGNHKSVNYNGLIGILIEAVKELKSEVDELKR